MPAVCDCFPELKSVTRRARPATAPPRRSRAGRPAVVAGDQGHLDRPTSTSASRPATADGISSSASRSMSRDRGCADAARISAVGGGRLLRRGVRVLRRKLGVELPKLRGGGADNFDVRGHMMPDAPRRASRSDHRHRGDERRAAEQLAEIERLALAAAPHCDRCAIRSGRDDANSDDPGQNAAAVA